MSERPRLLDLFCGAGGCAMGYYRAGFDVFGVDIKPQPRYPFAFQQADALDFLRQHGRGFDVIHASPPCQRYSSTVSIWGRREQLPDLVPTTRVLLQETGRLYVIENVPNSPLIFPALVCGLALGLQVKRHRLFESNVFLFGTTCPPGHRDVNITVAGHDHLVRLGNKTWVSVYGGGAPAKPDNRRRASVEMARKAMDIDWMTRNELSQAIPPAYTEFIGKQLIRALENAA